MEGAAALTPTRLHHETGVSRATIYRNWPDSTDLVAALLERSARDEFVVPAVVGPEEDLAELTAEVGRRLSEPELSALLLAGIDASRRSRTVAEATREFLAAMFGPLASALASAVDAGLLAGDPTELLSELVGPLLADQLLVGREIDENRARDLAVRLLASRRPTARSSPSGSTVGSLS